MMMFEVEDYLSPEGEDPYKKWLAELADRQARARVVVRVMRMSAAILVTANRCKTGFGNCASIMARAIGCTTRRLARG